VFKSHEKFYSVNDKRQVLVVDDELINRELMGAVLEADYEVLFAENGQQAMEVIEANRETLSLVLLDLMMPVMSGKEVLARIKQDPEMSQIPVIVLTVDKEAEAETFSLGAADYISKPYPKADAILARILRTIELYEDRQIIQSTERDPLTGLLNREYFYSFAEQLDQHHRDREMDAIVIDVNHFHMINERFGTAYGDDVLRRIGDRCREMVGDVDGIVCRREADTFLVYCPHGKDYRAILDHAADGLTDDEHSNNRVRLRMGVYAKVDKSLDIERRFDRAKIAADTVRNSFARTIGVYDKTLHERELYAEQLVEEFPAAIRDCQFKVFYQPKFDIRPEIPILASAEALVRWQHPTLGMISPGVFIPLFEENGLIQGLDSFVWRTVAAQIRDWKDRFGFSVPVSVNVSRIDMYDPGLVDKLSLLLDQYQLTPDDLYLEITESAYTQDSEQIIEAVNKLRDLGFCIEMDDFGTGYSSLNMISTLPIDALKLDMQFIRAAFGEQRDTHMIEVIIGIADYLGVPVIAEGVEQAEQLEALREVGCDLVQGYYFSRPVPTEEYERFVLERRDLEGSGDVADPAGKARAAGDLDMPIDKIAYALSGGFESIFYVDLDTDRYVEFSSDGRYADLQIKRSGIDFFTDAQNLIPHIVFEPDQQRISLCLQKDALLDQLTGGRIFSMTYRLNAEDRPVYHALKVVRFDRHGDHHIVLGVSNIDDQVREATDAHNEPDFGSLATALMSDMEAIYYVDTTTDTYQQLLTEGPIASLGLETSGTHFFEECRLNIDTFVYEDDRARLVAALDRHELLDALKEQGSISVDYRLLMGGRPTFYRLKAAAANAEGHVVIGVTNIDSQVSERERLEAMSQSASTFSRIAQALAYDYFSLYYVDVETDQFVEYNSYDEYSGLGIENTGSDFFGVVRENVRTMGYQQDVPRFLESFTKENVLASLRRGDAFTLIYRLMFDGKPTYVHMKATRMTSREDPHVVFGVSNIDEQMRREQEYSSALRSATEAAYRDPLTGVKSKHAYNEAEQTTDELIAKGEAEPFAMVLCDVNGLKAVNDTLGHAAGDELIRSACREICNVFAHSPVYRYGGDEFVVILRGGDYERRVELVSTIEALSRENTKTGDVTIACGMSEYVAGEDGATRAVFERADAAMYELKKSLKGSRDQG